MATMVARTDTRRVHDQATQLLAQAGCSWDGRKFVTKKDRQEQAAFERRMVRTPTGGVNGKHR